jgi:hypothetical protein
MLDDSLRRKFELHFPTINRDVADNRDAASSPTALRR